MTYSGVDGDSAARLIEASFALHRAIIALSGMGSDGLAQSCTEYLPALGGAQLALEKSGTSTTSAVDDIHTAVAHIDDVNAIIAAGAAEALLASIADTSEVGVELAERETACSTAEVQLPHPGVLERVGDDLNNSVVRAIFEAALVLQSALQFDCESGAVQRIEAAIELLDETVLQARTIIFGLSTSDGDR